MENNREINRVDDFEEMELKDTILRGIYGYGFEKPSEIQARAIVPMVSGIDIIAQAQSGTGKTGTFIIGTLQLIDENTKGCQALIVVPTRELAQQILNVCLNLGQYTKIKPVLCVGGTNIIESKNELTKTATIVIGTPGRIIDMIEKRYLSTRLVKLLVLDEADEMLSLSFQEQIKKIIQSISEKSQICLFSATMPNEVLNISKLFLREPELILVKQEELTLEGIKQFYIELENEDWKFDTFCDIYEMISINQSIIYVNTKKRAEWLKDKLLENNFTISIIHSEMKPLERTEIMKRFRAGDSRILISTDLLSRGIDIQQVSLVINYDLPYNKESYIHRIGRSGRFGRKGVAINLVSKKDIKKLEELKAFYSTQIDPMPESIKEYV